MAYDLSGVDVITRLTFSDYTLQERVSETATVWTGRPELGGQTVVLVQRAVCGFETVGSDTLRLALV